MSPIQAMLSSTPSGSTSGELNNTDALRSLRVGLTVIASQAAVLILQYIASMDFGDKTVFVTAAVTVAVELIRRKYVSNTGVSSGKITD